MLYVLIISINSVTTVTIVTTINRLTQAGSLYKIHKTNVHTRSALDWRGVDGSGYKYTLHGEFLGLYCVSLFPAYWMMANLLHYNENVVKINIVSHNCRNIGVWKKPIFLNLADWAQAGCSEWMLIQVDINAFLLHCILCFITFLL